MKGYDTMEENFFENSPKFLTSAKWNLMKSQWEQENSHLPFPPLNPDTIFEWGNNSLSSQLLDKNISIFEWRRLFDLKGEEKGLTFLPEKLFLHSPAEGKYGVKILIEGKALPRFCFLQAKVEVGGTIFYGKLRSISKKSVNGMKKLSSIMLCPTYLTPIIPNTKEEKYSDKKIVKLPSDEVSINIDHAFINDDEETEIIREKTEIEDLDESENNRTNRKDVTLEMELGTIEHSLKFQQTTLMTQLEHLIEQGNPEFFLALFISKEENVRNNYGEKIMDLCFCPSDVLIALKNGSSLL